MASQQAAIADTIRAMKLALRRQPAPSHPSLSSPSSDSDGQHTHTNRGNKLRPSAQYARESRLDTTGGQARYKRKVQHAGYERWTISKRRRLYDEDGDAMDPRDVPSEAEEAEYGEPNGEEAFGGVRLEELLRPLTGAEELSEHVGLRGAFTSKALTGMASEAAEMVRRERVVLWKAKRVLERLRGDGGFMACGLFETGGDGVLLGPERGAESEGDGVEGEGLVVVEGEEGGEGVKGTDKMEGVEAQDHVDGVPTPMGVGIPAQDVGVGDVGSSTGDRILDHTPGTNGDPTHLNAHAGLQHEQNPAPHPTVAELIHRDEESSSNSGTNPSARSHRMTTRARARSPQFPASPSPSPSDSSSIPSVHPWFLFPPSTLPDRDLGLPPTEAEELRKTLLLYVQKQENIVRQLTTLYDGLRRTDRLRWWVWRSCKAEGHVVNDGKGGVRTEMSDGEDWYDVGEWGLQEGWELRDGRLEKGKEEVDDTAEEEGRRVGGRRRRVVGR
ncbi:hypothetical protein B0A54_12189 [Friedmanniomyces endolithicus]|uniref:Transcriptional regulatory protein RXT2 N-terminal domain-containing protein n=1 Tax=Friedmanniomyces endolithicus TaxID=329885 RepID=A0A4U0UMF0_9PEZI|nr:hypothetical protein LTS09_014424 [Friedmanniomyces endolithicus]TKA35965.1 hypothetical protein B0A54_12189 [Friedmanniomyces endolithicus]